MCSSDLNKAVANKKLVLKDKKKTLKKGKTYTVAIKSMTSKTTDAVTYKSSKGSVAPVDKYGVVTAKKPGKATITVKCGKKSAKQIGRASCRERVSSPV